MGLYLVDYENVHDAGLEGISKLNAHDKVVVFYGIKIKAVPFDRHIEMMSCKAQIEYIKTQKVAKNYLDFQLSTYLGYQIGTGEKGPVKIISKDTGFDSLVDYWKSKNININRQVTITNKPSKANEDTTKEVKTESKKSKVSETKTEKPKAVVKETKNDNKMAKEVSESFRKKIRTAVRKEKLQASKYTAIYNAMAKAKNHTEYKDLIFQVFQDEMGDSVYNHTQNVFGEFINTKKGE